MNECFNDIIGMRGGCEAPTSDLLIDTIGVTLNELNDIIGEEYESGIELFNDKLSLATRTVSERVVNQISDSARQTSIIESARLGFYKDNQVIVSGLAGYLKGQRIELCNESSFVDVFVSEINLQVNYTGNVSVKVYDLIQNKLLDTLVVPCVSGEISSLIVNKTYKSKRKKLNLIFVYDSTGIDSYTSTVTRNFCSDCSGSYFLTVNQYLKAGGVKIASADSKILSNVTTVADTAGMSIIYSLQCNTTDWLCTFSNRMALSILYKTAYFLMEYKLNSIRQNSATLIDEEKTQKRMEFYDFEYTKSQGNLLKNIKTPTNDICFQCSPRSKHVFAM